MSRLGFNTFLKVGRESTYGTSVSRTVTFPVRSFGLAETVTWSPRETLDGIVNRAKSKSSVNVGGPVDLLVTYAGFGILWYALLGANSTSGPVSGKYTHALTLAKALPSLTCEAVHDSDMGEVFPGCMVTKGTIKVEPGKNVSATFDFIGRSSDGPASAGTPSHTTSRDLVVSFAEGEITWDGSTFETTSCEVTVDHKLQRRAVNGAYTTAKPNRSGPIDILVKIEVAWESNALQEAYRAGTSSNLQVLFTNDDGDELTILLHNAYIEAFSRPIQSHGLVKQTITFRAMADATNGGLAVTLLNEQSSLEAA